MKMDQALLFIESDWRFPVVPNLRLTDLKTRQSRLRRQTVVVEIPDANIGIATGQISKLAVVMSMLERREGNNPSNRWGSRPL
jgi:hypothetical protein